MTDELLPPHDEQAERSVLGGLIVDPDAYFRVRPVLEPDDFYVARNAWVYEAIMALFERDVPVDFVTLRDEVARAGRLEEMGGAAYLVQLVNTVPTSMHVKYYAEIVQGKAVRRRLIRAAAKAVQMAHDESVALDEAVRASQTALLDARRPSAAAADAYSLMSDLMDDVSTWSANPLQPGEVRGVATGLRPLDLAMGGLEAGLYLLAARTSVGKTALALQMASGIARSGGRVLFFTLETPAKLLGLRLASSLARVELDRVRRGVAAPDEYGLLVDAMAEISGWPLAVISGVATAGQVRTAIQRQQLSGSVAAAFVDGLWLMASATRAENRNLELGAISRELKLCADDLGVPVVAVHQLNRGVDLRANKRPLLSDLRESGRLEEDADVVLMLYRDGYYESTSPEANVMEVWVRKNRLGGPANRCVKLFWQGKFMRCEELEALEMADIGLVA